MLDDQHIWTYIWRVCPTTTIFKEYAKRQAYFKSMPIDQHISRVCQTINMFEQHVQRSAYLKSTPNKQHILRVCQTTSIFEEYAKRSTCLHSMANDQHIWTAYLKSMPNEQHIWRVHIMPNEQHIVRLVLKGSLATLPLPYPRNCDFHINRKNWCPRISILPPVFGENIFLKDCINSRTFLIKCLNQRH